MTNAKIKNAKIKNAVVKIVNVIKKINVVD